MKEPAEHLDQAGQLTEPVRVEQIHHLYAGLPSILVITSLLALLLFGFQWSVVDRGWLTVWLVGLLSINAGRTALLLHYRKRRQSIRQPGRWHSVYCLFAFLSGSMWGLSAWIVFPVDQPTYLALTTIIIAGLGVGAVINVAASWLAAWLFLAPALLPFLLRFLLLDGPGSWLTASTIGLFIVALSVLGRRLNRATLATLHAHQERADQFAEWRRQQRHYRSLVESTSAILWEADPVSLRFSYISPEVINVLGYQPERWTREPTFWKDHIHPEDRDWALRFCARAVEECRDHSFDYRMLAADGRMVWLRDVVKVEVRDGRAIRLVGAMIDISELKQTQQRLEYVSGLQQLMVETSRRFMRSSGRQSLDRTISRSLHEVGQYCGADRAYLIQFDDPAMTHYTNTHEWCAAGIGAEIDNLQHVSIETIPRMFRTLLERRPVHLPDVPGLGDEWACERELLLEQSIQSLIVVPVLSLDRLLGLVGFDSVARKRSWDAREIFLLQVLGDVVGAAITRASADQALRDSEALRVNAESLAGMGSWEWRIDEDRFLASAEWQKVAGLRQASLTSQQVLNLTPEPERDRVTRALRETLATGQPYDTEHRIVRPEDGQMIWIKSHAEVIWDGDRPKKLQGFIQDITARMQAQEKLYHLAHYDCLTELPNRVLVLDRLEQSLKRARRHKEKVAVLFLDLDQFKNVNDSLGHDAGDRILTQAAGRLRELLRQNDTVARIGGDEFLILLDAVDDLSQPATVAEKILAAFHNPLSLEDRELVLTVSIGIAMYPADGQNAHDLMRNADTAMYHAKQSGRDGFQFFTPSMNVQVARQLAIDGALRGALDRHELYLAYQPVVRLPDRRIVGAEALLRWTNCELGTLAPDVFIPVAEQIGLIEAIGQFVFARGIEALARWRNSGQQNFHLSINVSPRQFRDPRLAELILSCLRQNKVPGSALSIEITEGAVLAAKRTTQNTLKTLREAGVGVVMDDFGTGYSSLSYLSDYPFSSLKIDRRFISTIDRNPQDRQLVISALRLADSLNLSAVAEGVEREEQLEVLLAEGCRYAQGYLFGSAAGQEEIDALLSTGSALPIQS